MGTTVFIYRTKRPWRIWSRSHARVAIVACQISSERFEHDSATALRLAKSLHARWV